jgi:hypothetical protein
VILPVLDPAKGNEPDQWVDKGFRPAGYSYAEYKLDWETCAAAVGGKRIAARTLRAPPPRGRPRSSRTRRTGCPCSPCTSTARARTPRSRRCWAPSTVTAQLRSVSRNLAAAKANGLAFRIDEANSACSGGVDGVSNTYASALWGLDHALRMAQAGVDGINVHSGLDVCDEPIWNGKFQRYTTICAASAADEQAKAYKAMPVYYGLWMARQPRSGAFLPLTLTTDRNVTAYAVKGGDGRTRIAVVQKDETTAAPVHLDIAVDGRARGAEVLRLTGTALGEEATAVQGAAVDRQGHPKPGRADHVRVRDGKLGSAVVITLDGC